MKFHLDLFIAKKKISWLFVLTKELLIFKQDAQLGIIKGTLNGWFWVPIFFAKYVGPTYKIWMPQKKIAPHTIKGVLWPAEVLALLSSSSR